MKKKFQYFKTNKNDEKSSLLPVAVIDRLLVFIL